jgi:hypothetical protein
MIQFKEILTPKLKLELEMPFSMQISIHSMFTNRLFHYGRINVEILLTAAVGMLKSIAIYERPSL